MTVESIFTGNAGQVCVAGSRILVQRPVLDEMLKRIRAIAEEIVLGDPADDATTMGPLISREQYDRVVGSLKSGAEEAELVFGGRHGPELVPELPGGHWVDSRYHLASGVWTRDLARAHRFVRDLDAGNVWVNAYRQTRYELPFSGVKDSGYGHDAVLEFTREKAAVISA